MPFPWKNARVSRISRIVADLQSPTRGNSLVVETGFPTSLVDLFVKNRDRWRKPSRKKKKKQQQQQQQQQEQEKEQKLVISDPIPLSSSRDLVRLSDTFYVSNEDQRGQDLMAIDGCELVSELPVKKCVKVVNVRNGLSENEKRVLLVVLKTFIVVVLGLSTKKLAVGITVSAFVLIFLEHVGNHILCFLKPSSNVPAVVESLIRKVFSLLSVLKPASNCESFKKGLIIREDEDHDGDVSVVGSCVLIETLELNPGIEEIHVVESNLDVVSQVEEERRTDLVACDTIWGCLDVDLKVGVVEVGDDKNGALECEKQCSGGSKIKTKIMKKLVPKKLRGRKKVKKREERDMDLNSEMSSCWGHDKLARNEALEERKNDDKQDSEGRGKELVSQLLEEEHDGQKESRKAEEDIEFVDEISSSSAGMQTEEKIIIVGETEKNGCCGYLILILIILAGLVGGRILALVFTVVSCLMLKLVGRCGKLANKPLNRSPASILI